MSLLHEALEQSAQSLPGPRCGVSKLDPDLIAEVDEAVAQCDGSSLTLQAVAKVLKDRGHHVSANTLSRHRAGNCSCDRR